MMDNKRKRDSEENASPSKRPKTETKGTLACDPPIMKVVAPFAQWFAKCLKQPIPNTPTYVAEEVPSTTSATAQGTDGRHTGTGKDNKDPAKKLVFIHTSVDEPEPQEETNTGIYGPLTDSAEQLMVTGMSGSNNNGVASVEDAGDAGDSDDGGDVVDTVNNGNDSDTNQDRAEGTEDLK